jgi:hypothetical protein
MSTRAIDEIEDRLKDLGDALRAVGSPDIASMLEHHALDFTEPTRVRRSVNAIRSQLERWRIEGGDLPEAPTVLFAANRLEDACRDALAAGVIAVAPPSLGAQSRRKLAIALVTLLCGGLSLLIPTALVRFGVDFSDVGAERTLGPVQLPRGEEDTIAVVTLAGPLRSDAVTGVEFEPVGGCKEPLRKDATCAEVPPRLWPEGRLPTYELKLKHQAYGLLFSIADGRLSGPIGEGRLLLAATDDTPEGRYEIPLHAAFLGYTPQRCDPLEKLQSACPAPRIGEGERHAGVEVPVVLVDVVRGDPARRSGEKRLALAEAEEKRRRAEERAQQIAAAVTEIGSALAETERLVKRGKYEEARGHVSKLALLFSPLDAVAVEQGAAELVPAAVSEVRTRFERLRDGLEAFENKLFEQTFAIVTAESNRRVPEESLLQRIARQFRVTPGYVQEIYTGRADEIARRLEAREKAHLDKIKAAQQALERRCGPLPTRAWSAVNAYVQRTYAEARVEIELGECMTPRLTEQDCWELRCDFKRKVEVAVERPKVVTKHDAAFYLIQERVVRHRGG